MARDIEQFISKFYKWQTAKRSNNSHREPLHPYFVHGVPYEVIHCDVIGPLVKTVYVTHSPWLTALQSFHVSFTYKPWPQRKRLPPSLIILSVSMACHGSWSRIMAVIISLGLWKTLQNYYKLSANLLQLLCLAKTVRPRSSTSLCNQHFVSMLTRISGWSCYLVLVSFAFNSTPNEGSICFTHAFIMFGRKCSTPLDILLIPQPDSDATILVSKYVKEVRENLLSAWSIVKQNSEWIKAHTNQTARPPTFKINDVVLCKHFQTPVRSDKKL